MQGLKTKYKEEEKYKVTANAMFGFLMSETISPIHFCEMKNH